MENKQCQNGGKNIKEYSFLGVNDPVLPDIIFMGSVYYLDCSLQKESTEVASSVVPV